MAFPLLLLHNIVVQTALKLNFHLGEAGITVEKMKAILLPQGIFVRCKRIKVLKVISIVLLARSTSHFPRINKRILDRCLMF